MFRENILDMVRRLHILSRRRLWSHGLVMRWFAFTNAQYFEFREALVKTGRQEQALRYLPRSCGGAGRDDLCPAGRWGFLTCGGCGGGSVGVGLSGEQGGPARGAGPCGVDSGGERVALASSARTRLGEGCVWGRWAPVSLGRPFRTFMGLHDAKSFGSCGSEGRGQLPGG